MHRKDSVVFQRVWKNNYEPQDKIGQFYKTHFWIVFSATSQRRSCVAYPLFDFAVNAGAGTSVVLAQHVARCTVPTGNGSHDGAGHQCHGA